MKEFLEAEPPPTIGRFVAIREIARGAMGLVLEAEDPALGRRVALKLVRSEGIDGRAVARLQREAKIAARLDHPNIVRVYEAGVEAGVHYIAMELIEGRPFEEVIDVLPLDDRLRILEDIARALDYAHRQGVVHRDVKPANVLVDAKGHAWLADFGLARADAFRTRLTRSHAVMGTPCFMAPEQVRGEAHTVGPQADVYALGVALYRCLAGTLPFEGTSITELYQSILVADPVPPGRLAKVDPDLERVCLAAMEKDPRYRTATSLAFADDLARARRGDRVQARPRGRISRLLARWKWPIAAALLLAAAAIPVGIALQRRDATVARKRHVEDEFRRFADVIRDTRAHFYIEGADVPAKLDRVRAALDELRALSADPEFSRRPETWALLGLGAWHSGDRDGAKRDLEKAEELGTSDPAVAFALLRLYLERSMMELLAPERAVSHEPGRAREWSRRVAGRAWPEEIDRRIAEAYIALVDEQNDRVVELCRAGLETYGRAPGTEEFCNLLGWVEGSRDRSRQAPHYRDALARRPHYPWAWFMIGAASLATEKYADAIGPFSRAIEQDPRFALAWNNRGMCRQRTGDLKGALADLDTALRLDPNCVIAYVNRGTVHEDLGDRDASLADFETVIRISPRTAAAWNNRGNLRRTQGLIDDALADFDEAIRIDPDYAHARANRALIYRHRGRYDEAIADLDAALRARPSAAMLIERAVVHHDRGDLRAAMRDCDAALALEPASANAFAKRGTFRLAARDVDGALRDFDEAMRLDPKLPEPWSNRGVILMERRQFDEALADFARALELDPRLGAAWTNRGNIKYMRRDLDGALAEFDKSIACDASAPEPHAMRGMVLRDKGDKAGAIESFRRALSLASPSWPHRATVEKQLDALERDR